MNRKLKSLLIKNGIKQKDIAKRVAEITGRPDGVSRSTVSGVLGGHAQSRPVKQATADLLGINIDRLEKLWVRKVA